MKKMNSRFVAMGIAAAIVLTAIAPAGISQAAAKPKLAKKTISVQVKKSKTIEIKNKKGFKISFKSKNAKIASVNAKGKVTGKKKGSTKVTVYYKKGKGAKKKLGVVSVKVTDPQKTKTPEPSSAVQTQTQSSTPAPAVTQTPPAVTTAPPVLATVEYPTLYADIPDPDIIRVESTYYMVSTTMNMCPGVPVMKSTDLVHWEIVNYVYDTFEDDNLTNLENGKDMYRHGSWAASLKYNEDDGKFYVAFNSNDHGFYVYTTTDIENGPWKKHSTKNKFHDPGLLFDDGKMYVFSGSTLQQLELDDEKGTVENVGKSVSLFNKAHLGNYGWTLWEGAHAYKIGEYYYLFIIASQQEWMRTEVCYRSKSLEPGDWEEQVIYRGGCGGYGTGLAQGGVVDTPNGDWYGFLFQDHNGAGRIPSIVAVNWDYTDDEGNNYKDWPMLGTYDENGTFQPSTAEQPMTINLYDSGKKNYFVADDDFTYNEGDKLKLVWQWNHNPQNDFWSVTANPGYLRLTTDRTVDNLFNAHNSLTQRTYGPTCKSETKISVANMKAGDYAGLASVADHGAMVGVKCDENGTKYITQSGNQFMKEPVDNEKVELGDATEVYLKIEYDFTGDKANFFYSMDGENWTKIGREQKLAFSTSTTFMGARTWLFNYATQEAGGYVDFDYYKIYD